MSYAELLQVGRMGLWQAVLHFDPGRGVAFSTYARVAVKHRKGQAVERAQRRQGWLVAEQPVDPLALAEERLWWAEVCGLRSSPADCGGWTVTRSAETDTP